MVDPFEKQLGPHLDRLYRLAYRLTGNVADAEDLLQDVLVKLYARRAELSSIRDLSPWVGRVLYNQFIDDKRRYGRQPVRLVDDIEAHGVDERGPARLASAEEALTMLQAALAQLSEEHRIVILLHDAEGYKLSEIQEVTDTSLGTIKSRLHRARARLRELLKQDGTFFDAAPCSEADGVNFDVLQQN